MDVSSIIFLSLIVSAFIIFAVTLAYGDYATVQARRKKGSELVKPELPVQHRDAA